VPAPVESLSSVVERFGHLKLLVVGDAILDVWMSGQASRLCREAPVPVVTLDNRQELPGGAANAALNAASLGAQVTLLSVIGGDQAGTTLRERLGAAGVDANRLVVQPTRATLLKRRVVADGQLLVRLDEGDETPLRGRAARRLTDHLAESFLTHDAVLVSDYAAGTIGSSLIAALARLQATAPRVLVIDAKNLAAYQGVGATAVKPNYQETIRLLGLHQAATTSHRVDQLKRDGQRILSLLNAHMAAVTLDSEGALLFEQGVPPYRTYAHPVPASKATGAGDTFAAVLALALAAGCDLPAAGELASAAATIAVDQTATATASCSQPALQLAVAGDRRRVTDLEQLRATVARHRQEGRRIVFTNGCFDLLHRGHVAYLNQAKTLGDVLMVAVNADASVRRLKGPGRPVNTLEDRMAVLAALSCIDHLVAFEDDSPVELLRIIRPDLLVKGGDYRRDGVPEGPLVEALGGRVEILPYLHNQSTTAMIQRIRTG
jgi:D-beta-D-heptose 7-phosphate kinase / D-beta-D-heptose 1-phosphate adenosyltransferase